MINLHQCECPGDPTADPSTCPQACPNYHRYKLIVPSDQVPRPSLPCSSLHLDRAPHVRFLIRAPHETDPLSRPGVNFLAIVKFWPGP